MITKTCQNACAAHLYKTNTSKELYSSCKNNRVWNYTPRVNITPHFSQHAHTADSAVTAGKCTQCYNILYVWSLVIAMAPLPLQFSYLLFPYETLTVVWLTSVFEGHLTFSWGFKQKTLVVSVWYIFRMEYYSFVCEFRL